MPDILLYRSLSISHFEYLISFHSVRKPCVLSSNVGCSLSFLAGIPYSQSILNVRHSSPYGHPTSFEFPFHVIPSAGTTPSACKQSVPPLPCWLFTIPKSPSDYCYAILILLTISLHFHLICRVLCPTACKQSAPPMPCLSSTVDR